MTLPELPLRDQRITDALAQGIIADRLYEPYLAAALLGIRSARAEKTLAEIPAALLPVHRVGPTGGLKRYLGRNLLAYIRSTGVITDDQPMTLTAS